MKKRSIYRFIGLTVAAVISLGITGVFANPQGKRVLMVIAPRDFSDREFNIPKKVFEKAKMQVAVASSSAKNALSSSGTSVKPDLTLNNVNAADYDAVVFVGGLGVKDAYWNDTKAQKIARDAVSKNKILGAICWAPVILANAGVLDGKRATVSDYEGAGAILVKKGSKYTGEPLTIEGKIITANGPDASADFAEAIVKSLR